MRYNGSNSYSKGDILKKCAIRASLDSTVAYCLVILLPVFGLCDTFQSHYLLQTIGNKCIKSYIRILFSDLLRLELKLSCDGYHFKCEKLTVVLRTRNNFF